MVGSIHVICGPMFSGKTTELLRLLSRAKYAGVKSLLFKPSIDSRFSTTSVVSHSDESEIAIVVDSALDILNTYTNDNSIKMIAIDEAQFFSKDEKYNLIYVINKLKIAGVRVIVNGLDLDYRGNPFGVMPDLLALANTVLKLTAICKVCGHDAEMTYKLSKNSVDSNIEVGSSDKYEARCFNHWSSSDIHNN